jgi:bifunctional non-homologous end joining protein LigD
MLQRCPSGIDEECFYQKNVAPYFPSYVKRVSVTKADGRVTHAVANNAETLTYLADLGCITPHMWLSRTPKLNYPDVMIFDLDPSSDDFRVVREMALGLRDLLRELGLESFPMTTGSRGLHVSVPLDGTDDFEAVRDFARDVAHGLADAYPDIVTTAQLKKARRGRLFVDVMRNAYAQTVVSPYALRAKTGAPVATPLDWSEVDRRLHSQRFTIRNIFQRLKANGDAWVSIWSDRQSLKRSREILDTWIPASDWKAA